MRGGKCSPRQPSPRIPFADDGAIRADSARAVPFYRGIESLSKQGDQFQWGGPMLCADRNFMTQDGKAHFQPVVPPGLGATPQIGFKRATTR